MSRLSIGEAIQQVVGVLSGVSDTREFLRVVTHAARQMMSSDEAYLLLREGGRLVLRAADGLPESLLGRSPFRAGEGIEGWVADHGEPVAISNASQERRFRDIPGREGRVRALAVVPMRLRDDVVGVLATAGIDLTPPAGSRLIGLEILAGIAAVAIENDRLLSQERRRAHQSEMLLELAGINDLELWPFMQTVADTINSSLGVDDTELVLLDQGGAHVICVGRPRGDASGQQCDEQGSAKLLSSRWVKEVLSTGQPLICDDVTLDPHLLKEFRGTPTRSLIAVPIMVEGERRGILRVASTHAGRFGSEDLAFLSLIATQVGLSVERTDLARRQLEVSRQQARQQARQEFLGIVSHELKTPVAVLKAYTELLQRKAELDPQRVSDQEVLERMLEQSDRMLAMIEQSLDLQKIETGQFSLEISDFDLVESARRVAENMQLTAQDHTVVFESEASLLIQADKRRIEEVLSNLLDNAVKYSPAGSQVKVSVKTMAGQEADGCQALVSVCDQGIGIPQQDITRIFARFYQGRGRFHRGHVGLGLGLYIARETVERHRGRIWAESVEGQGSTFFFTLPLTALNTEE